jgi:15-cis-phytoene synthase
MQVDAAYRHCQQLTWDRARNFSYGIRLLPRPKRRALCAVYALARRLDDIGDGELPAEEKLRRLQRVRADLGRLADRADPVAVALADAAARFPIPLAAFQELVDGVELDVRGATYVTFEELLHYCRCVAGSIGRLSLGVFGSRDPAQAPALADALGVAMQLTNILRDVAEDAAAGRRYLPQEDLARFGCGQGLDVAPDRVAALVGFEVARAERWFERGLRLLPLLDRRSAACVAAMAGIYRALLARIARQPQAVLQGRICLPAQQKAVIAARSLTGVGR